MLEELHRLPKNMRTPMVLRYIGGKSNSEIAEELNLSTSAVEGRLKRGRNQLRLRLARLGIGFGAVTMLLSTLGRESHAAESASLVARTVEACCGGDVGVGTHISKDAIQLANEEIIKMTSFKVSTTLLWTTISLATIATGWAIAGDGGTFATGIEGGFAETEIRLAQSGEASDTLANVSLGAAPGPKRLSNQERLRKLGYFSVDEQTEQSIKNLEALQGRTKLDFTDAPLVEVVQVIREMHSIQLVVDRPALEETGLTVDTPVSINLQDVQLKNALHLMLADLNLTFIQRNEVVVITTREVAEDTMFTRAYRTESKWTTGIEDIVASITTNIKPDSWKELGGPGAISILGSGIVVTNSEEVHDKINRLFAQLHRIEETP